MSAAFQNDEVFVIRSKSTALCALHSEATALIESRHPERSVLGEVKDLGSANLRFFTAAKNAALQRRSSSGSVLRYRRVSASHFEMLRFAQLDS